jgi:4-alpha-glucanotransferase
MRDAWGIEHRYEDAQGREHRVSRKTIESLRQVMGDPPRDGPSFPLVVRRGARTAIEDSEIILEDGSVVAVDGILPPDLPLGYHIVRPKDGSRERRLILSPGRCHLPAGWRAWGWAGQLYAARSERSWGIGDFADLRRLARWSARRLGAGFVLVNPLHASAPVLPQHASPYFPSSRRFRNPIYLNVDEVPGADLVKEQIAIIGKKGRELNGSRLINRDEVWLLKMQALQAIRDKTGEGGDFDRWLEDQGQALDEFATWNALAEQLGSHWPSWPEEYRHPGNPAVARFRQEQAVRVRFYAWLQWLAGQQLTNAATDVAIIQDLAIGVDPNGADAWAWQDLFAAGVSIGAPPDEFNSQGQNWSLPPFIPWKLREAGYQPFIDTIRASLASGGGLRLDHVMGLFRLWWIPRDARADEGAYVRYSHEDLLNIVALESQRAGAVVVGEDLGTVEKGVRETLAERNVLSYRLLWFEEDPPSKWPELALGATTTHDLPTVAGLWTGTDLEEQRELGLEPSEASTEAIRQRLADQGGLKEDASAEEAVQAAYRLLAKAPSVLLAATLDDAQAVPERPNMPGTDGKRPNWSIALPLPLESFERAAFPQKVAGILRDAIE